MSRRALRPNFHSVLIATLLISVALGPMAAAQPEDASVVIDAGLASGVPVLEKHDGPVFTVQYIASDPAIIVEDDLLRLFYTCFVVPSATDFVPENVRAGICSATSIDGMTWTEVDSGDPLTRGLVLRGIEDSWQEHLEAAFAVKIDDTYLLYYSGYETEGDPALGYPAMLSVASSTDGIHFERVTDRPILSPTPGWYDNDAVYSPAIAIANDQLVMVYAGHCYTDCPLGYGVTLLGATSSDGLTWEKNERPILQGAPLGLDWTTDGVAEPALNFGPDGRWHLFFTSVAGELREIGVASGLTPFGPWEVLDAPVLTPTPGSFDEGGVLAPFVLFDESRLRMWYLGVTEGEERFAIGYAEAPLP